MASLRIALSKKVCNVLAAVLQWSTYRLAISDAQIVEQNLRVLTKVASGKHSPNAFHHAFPFKFTTIQSASFNKPHIEILKKLINSK